jgi:hypothetical protein
MEEVEMDVPAGRERPEDCEQSGGKAGQAEEPDPVGKPDDRWIGANPGTGGIDSLSRAGLGDPPAQRPPEVGLPDGVRSKWLTGAVGVAAGEPGSEHLGPVGAVAVEEVGQVAGAPQAAGSADGILNLAGHGVVGAAEVGGERLEPGLGEGVVDHLEQRPEGPVGEPGVVGRVDARGLGDGIAG